MVQSHLSIISGAASPLHTGHHMLPQALCDVGHPMEAGIDVVASIKDATAAIAAKKYQIPRPSLVSSARTSEASWRQQQQQQQQQQRSHHHHHQLNSSSSNNTTSTPLSSDKASTRASSTSSSSSSQNSTTSARSGNSGAYLLTSENLRQLAALHPPRILASDHYKKPPLKQQQQQFDTASQCSSTHFTVVNGLGGRGQPASRQKSCCARNQLTVLVCTMTLLFSLGLLAAVVYMEMRARARDFN